MPFIDTHCHIYEFKNIEAVIKRALEKGVYKIIAVGDDPESNKQVLSIYEKYPNIVLPSIGYHPWEAAKATKKDIEEFKRQVEENLEVIVGLGEIGLDKRFVRGEEKLERQRMVFNVAVELAKEYDLPLNIHSMKTEKEILNILLKKDITKAVFHWYTGSYEVLRKIIEVGYYISVNLSLRYSSRAKEVANRTPLGLILLESDSPYYFKGEYSTPEKVVKVAELLANVKGVDIKTVEYVTTRGAQLLYSI